jgi:predicted DNA-binding transcriptional regulator AlpA
MIGQDNREPAARPGKGSTSAAGRRHREVSRVVSTTGITSNVTAASENLLTTEELALRWRTTEQAVYAARHRGNCPPALRVGRRLLWRLRDIEAWETGRLEPVPSS